MATERSGELLTFIHLPGFVADCKRLRLDDEDVRRIELAILEDPTGAPVMAGTGGLRKMWFAPRASGRGKSGGARVGYAYFVHCGTVLLVAVFAKNEKANFTPTERNAIRQALAGYEAELSRGGPPAQAE